jgi:hypothetical protein
MNQNSIITALSEFDAFNQIQDSISTICGTIKKVEQGIIQWEYVIGVHTIYCETWVKVLNEGTEVTTTAESKTKKGSLNSVIIKLHQNLLDSKIESHYVTSSGKMNNVKKNKTNYTTLLLTIFVLFTFGSVVYNEFDGFWFSSAKSSFIDGTSTDREYRTIYGYYGANTEGDLDMLMRYISNDDNESLERLYKNGKLIILPNGANCYLVESSFGKVKIQIEGSGKEIWTLSDGIEKK